MTKRPVNRLNVIGAGRWGRAVASAVKEKGFEIRFIEADTPQKDWDTAFSEKNIALITTPFSAVRETLKRIKTYPKTYASICGSKGIDRKTLKTFSPMAKEAGLRSYLTLSGPSFARELQQKKPTACVLASSQIKLAQELCALLSTQYFRLYAHRDPIGVEICGATKNILAIACGISDGLKLGANARAALLNRGLIEMMNLVEFLGGKPATALGLAGMGDLWLTATGNLSRNRKLGLLIAQGQKADRSKKQINQPVEGLYTLKQIHQIAKKNNLDLPICRKVYEICVLHKPAKKAIHQLMSRNLKTEDSSNWKLIRRSSSKL